ncbi:hypothetical protein F383_27839 [Gossypium arboreum]|uniref:Uncharacterized protein n=1 Tax=Gossypium arboreum TaxID=29729 RepID=A0A0B0PD62_GOSAR|nr:hypothetical protein F383_27839 [Gossypium arboreum]
MIEGKIKFTRNRLDF